jgi:hypothetical protein
MRTVRLNSFPYFDNSKALEDLNRLVELYDNLMPHQVAAATGCRLQDAMGVLMLLVSHSLAEAVLLVYHISDPIDPLVPFLSRSIYDGLPTPPLLCDVCGNEIETADELTYDFSFKLASAVHFTY